MVDLDKSDDENDSHKIRQNSNGLLVRLLAAVTQGSSFVENSRLIEASLSSHYFE
jgi:hypothetical protein